jgi:hypothetical protein
MQLSISILLCTSLTWQYIYFRRKKEKREKGKQNGWNISAFLSQQAACFMGAMVHNRAVTNLESKFENDAVKLSSVNIIISVFLDVCLHPYFKI